VSEVHLKGGERLVSLLKLSVISLNFLLNYLLAFVISLLKDFEDLFDLYDQGD
jgi:hypothetical protein